MEAFGSSNMQKTEEVPQIVLFPDYSEIDFMEVEQHRLDPLTSLQQKELEMLKISQQLEEVPSRQPSLLSKLWLDVCADADKSRKSESQAQENSANENQNKEEVRKYQDYSGTAVIRKFQTWSHRHPGLARRPRKEHLLKKIIISVGTIIQKHERWISKPKSRQRFRCFQGQGWEQLLEHIQNNSQEINHKFFLPKKECQKRIGCKNDLCKWRMLQYTNFNENYFEEIISSLPTLFHLFFSMIFSELQQNSCQRLKEFFRIQCCQSDKCTVDCINKWIELRDWFIEQYFPLQQIGSKGCKSANRDMEPPVNAAVETDVASLVYPGETAGKGSHTQLSMGDRQLHRIIEEASAKNPTKFTEPADDLVDMSISSRGGTPITQIKQYACQLCGKTYARQSSLRLHMKRHTGEKPYHCEFPGCGKHFQEKGNLKTHMRIHTKEKPYQWDQCGKAFSTLGHLTDHLRRHTGERPFKCIKWDESFMRISTLRIHMRRHTGEKPYETKTSAKSHSSPGDTAFLETKEIRRTPAIGTTKGSKNSQTFQEICCNDLQSPSYEICVNGFIERRNIKTHQRIHTGERPYVSPYMCGQSLNTKMPLNEHLMSKRHRKEEVE